MSRDSLILEDILREVGATYDSLRNQINRNMETIMAELDDKLAGIQAAQATTNSKLDAVKVDVDKLVAAVAVIPNPPPATLTPEQQAALGDILTHAGAINDGLSAIDTAANTPTTQAAPIV